MLRDATLQRIASLLMFVACGCGANVVFDEDADTGGAASDGGASAGGNGPSTSSDTTTSFQTTTGPSDPCLGLPCGETCFVCNDFECVEGFCDDDGVCDPVVVACRTHQLCYAPDPDARCAPAGKEAEFLLCDDCGGGKGCSFFGLVVQGPFVQDGACCYEVTGDCVPNP
jgi:hypothetical protein